MNEPLPGPPLRIAVLADFEGLHTHRWLRVFVQRGHDVHAISYYPVAAELPGVTVHVLTGQSGSREMGQSAAAPRRGKLGFLKRLVAAAFPPSVLRIMHGRRYMRAGLRRVLDEIRPDVFQAHYVVEHGYYGSRADVHPFVVNAWGSDLYQAPKSPLGRWIAHRVLRKADLVSCNDPELREEALKLGARFGDTIVVRLGVDEVFFEQPHLSVNMESGASAPPVIISDRALEPLYNIDVVLRAFAVVLGSVPEVRLVVANDGSQRRRLESLSRELHIEASVDFVGRLEPEALRDELARAQVYVSVPDSDSLALSTMEAMAVGALPVVSDLPSQTWIDDGENGLRVPVRDVDALATALQRALKEHELRFRAIAVNRVRVQMEGNLTRNMLALEKHFYRLADEAR